MLRQLPNPEVNSKLEQCLDENHLLQLLKLRNDRDSRRFKYTSCENVFVMSSWTEPLDLMQCWKQEWVTPKGALPGSTYKVLKWVKSEQAQVRELSYTRASQLLSLILEWRVSTVMFSYSAFQRWRRNGSSENTCHCRRRSRRLSSRFWTSRSCRWRGRRWRRRWWRRRETDHRRCRPHYSSCFGLKIA